MTADQWYIAIALVLLIVIIAYFVLHKHGDTTAVGSTQEAPDLGSSSGQSCYNYWTQPRVGMRKHFYKGCPSGYTCSDNNGGTCMLVQNNPTGAACSGSWDCASRTCALQSASSGAPMVCCPPGLGTDHNRGKSYCKGMPTGSECYSDYMCASGNCKGDMRGLRKGKCA
jgi:hypothetical protein